MQTKLFLIMLENKIGSTLGPSKKQLNDCLKALIRPICSAVKNPQ